MRLCETTAFTHARGACIWRARPRASRGAIVGNRLTASTYGGIMPAMSTPIPLDEWLSPRQAAALLRVSRATLFRRLQAGELDTVRQYRPGARRVYLHRGDLLLWMDAHTRRPDS